MLLRQPLPLMANASVPWPQDFWPDAIASSRVFALGEVWHNALVSEVKQYADAIRRGPISGFHRFLKGFGADTKATVACAPLSSRARLTSSPVALG